MGDFPLSSQPTNRLLPCRTRLVPCICLFGRSPSASPTFFLSSAPPEAANARRLATVPDPPDPLPIGGAVAASCRLARPLAEPLSAAAAVCRWPRTACFRGLGRDTSLAAASAGAGAGTPPWSSFSSFCFFSAASALCIGFMRWKEPRLLLRDRPGTPLDDYMWLKSNVGRLEAVAPPLGLPAGEPWRPCP